MAIPSKEILRAGIQAAGQMKVQLRKAVELLTVALNDGVPCNGLHIPLAEDSIQPLIDEYLVAKAELTTLFQELP